MSNLALEIRKDRTTVVRTLKPLEERGFIIDVAVKHTRDRQLKVTDKGFKILEKNDMNTLAALFSKIEALVP